MTEWRTAAELAEHLGVDQAVVDQALRRTGMLTASRYHARGEGADRAYSLSAQELVHRELKADGMLARARLRKRQTERSDRVLARLEADRGRK